MSEKRSLFAELKRRNVLRASAAYVALGWVVTQVTATVAPMLQLPQWTGPLVLWIGIVGFPFLVIFAWIYASAVNCRPSCTLIHVDSSFVNVRSDPRWLPLLRKHGIAPEQLAKIEFKFALPGDAGATPAG